jgi:lysophospholipase L1-like esterase
MATEFKDIEARIWKVAGTLVSLPSREIENSGALGVNENRFDQLTRSMATKASRRGVLKGVLAAVSAIALGKEVAPATGWAAPGIIEKAPRRYQDSQTLQYFALGDSVASGHGLGADCDDDCLRSDRAYPYVLAKSLRNEGYVVELHHFACSGATSGAQGQGEKTLGYQVDEVLELLSSSDDPALVTITIGANDFHWHQRDFLQGLTEPSDADFESMVVEISRNLRVNVIEQVNRLLEASQQLVIVITDYYNPFDTSEVFGDIWVERDNPFRRAPTSSGGLPARATKEYQLARFWGLQTGDTVPETQSGIQPKDELKQVVARMDRMIDAINEELALAARSSLDPSRVQRTATIKEAFASHPAVCLFPLVGASTWIQDPVSGDSNSIRCVFGGREGEVLRGDCIHPNALGAQAIASELLQPTLHMLGILGLSPNS